jgi:hypothetical protein
MHLFSLNSLNLKKIKKNSWVVLGCILALFLMSALCIKLYKSYASKPRSMAHSIEYNSVVNEHIDVAKLPRSEIDQSVTKQELGQRLAVYQFNHPKLRGKWGNLNVFVDRQTGKSVSRSLLPINKAQPTVTLSNLPECLMVAQPDQSDYEVCVR